MDPLTAALDTAGKWIDLQSKLFDALPAASKTALSEKLFEDGQFVRELIDKAAAHFGWGPLATPAPAPKP